jgi:hypothetical protein
MDFQLTEQSNDSHLVKASKAPELFLPMSVEHRFLVCFVICFLARTPASCEFVHKLEARSMRLFCGLLVFSFSITLATIFLDLRARFLDKALGYFGQECYSGRAKYESKVL